MKVRGQAALIAIVAALVETNTSVVHDRTSTRVASAEWHVAVAGKLTHSVAVDTVVHVVGRGLIGAKTFSQPEGKHAEAQH